MRTIARRMGAAISGFFRSPERAAVQARVRRHRGPEGMVDAADESLFLDKLKAILMGNGGTAQAGRINVIGLDRIKAKLGERWDELSDRVHTVARSAIEKCLQPQDVWIAHGNSYVIAFGRMNIEEAQAKCRIIAQIIENALLGEAHSDGVSVATAVATVDGRVLLRDLPSLDGMLAQAPAVRPTLQPNAAPLPSPPPPESGPVPRSASPMSEDRTRREESSWSMTDERIARREHPSLPIAERMPAQPTPAWIARERERVATAPGPWPQVEERAVEVEAWRPGGTPGAASPIWPSIPHPVGASVPPPVETLEIVPVEEDPKDEIVWEPVWDVRHERVPIYRAKYVRHSRAWLQRPSDELLDRADFALRDTVLRELTGCLLQSRCILLGLPVRFWTVASYAGRRDYLSALVDRVSLASRKFLLIFITDVPDGVPAARMLELLGAVRPFCREIVIETSPQVAEFAALGSTGVFAVGTDLSHNTEPERVLMRLIDQFARGATKAGIANCCLAGVESMPLITAAIAAGFRYISGSSVGALGLKVSNVWPLSLDYVYRANVEAKGLRWPEKKGAA
jgi:hypothetical protein